MLRYTSLDKLTIFLSFRISLFAEDSTFEVMNMCTILVNGSLVPSLPFPNTNLRKRDKRRETAKGHSQFFFFVKQGDWSRG